VIQRAGYEVAWLRAIVRALGKPTEFGILYPKRRSGRMDDNTAEKRAELRAQAESRWGAAMAAAQSADAGVTDARVAYEKMLAELLPVVRRMVRAKLFDPTYVEDVVQNALLSIHRARATYRPERPFGPWLRAVVRNALIDWFRESRRRSEREVITDVMEEHASAPATDELEAGELAPELSAALAALPEKQREAVLLVQVEGLSVAEAALRAGVSPGALKVRAHRGYRAMRARFANGFGDKRE
jgi:RNA polymerase sigma factor (sigma-70 family)